MARPHDARRGARAPRGARRRRDGARRRDVPRHPHEPGLHPPGRRCSALRGVAGLDGDRVVDGELRARRDGDASRRRALAGGRRVARAAARVRPRRQPAGAQPGDGRRRARRRRLRLGPAGDVRRARRARRPALGARRAGGRDRGADPRPLRDVHRAATSCWSRCACRRSPSARSTASSARARRRTAVRRGRGGARRARRCASSSARWRTRRSRSPTSARSRTARALDSELAAEIGRRYAERIEPISDARGSAAYRRRVIAVEVRRALEELA